MKQIITRFSLVLLVFISFSSLIAQTVNMNSYIILNVKQGENILLRTEVDSNNTGVRIISGTTDTTITVEAYLVGNLFMAGATTMTIYGNVKVFDCSSNKLKITGLNASHNSELVGLFCSDNSLTSLDVSNNLQLNGLSCYNNRLTSLNVTNLSQLEFLWCFNNNFSTSALDSIYCQLPQKEPESYAWIMPIENDTSSNYAIVMATNKQNAISKNWIVKYEDLNDIPATTGTYTCNIGIEDVNKNIISAKIYPNPLTKDVTIEANEYIDRLEVLNVLGKKIFTKEVNKNNTTLDFSKMNRGTYIIKLFSAKGESTYKVVKK